MSDRLERCLSEIEDIVLEFEQKIATLEQEIKMLKTNLEERCEREWWR